MIMMQANKTKEIIFGAGCFWCTEAVFKEIKGVIKVVPGYAGGTVENPTYEEVCAGKTGHAEAVKVEYDESETNLDKLLDIYFSMHDPTAVNEQGNDMGNQYRSVIFYSDDEQKQEVLKFIESIRGRYNKPIATRVEAYRNFYEAEEYHKDYYRKNPLQPYCMIVIRPKLHKIRKEFPDDLEGPKKPI